MLETTMILLITVATAIGAPTASVTNSMTTSVSTTVTVVSEATPPVPTPDADESALPPWLQWINTYLGAPIEVFGVLSVLIGIPSAAALVANRRKDRKRLQTYFTTIWKKSSHLDLDGLGCILCW